MLFVLLFALVFVWYGIKFVQFGWNQTSELADMPMTYIFIAWPLTGLTWLLFGGERLLADIRFLRYGAMPGDARRRARSARERRMSTAAEESRAGTSGRSEGAARPDRRREIVRAIPPAPCDDDEADSRDLRTTSAHEAEV